MKRRLGFVVLSLFLIAVLILSTGCSRRLIDFTVISSKNVHLNVPEDAMGERVEGKDLVWWIFFIPLGTPHVKEAVDDAIEQAGPGFDALIDGVIYVENYWFVLTGYSGFRVEGTPIKTSQLITQLEERGEDVELAMNKVLYHSTTGLDNTEAIEEIGITKVNKKPDQTPADN